MRSVIIRCRRKNTTSCNDGEQLISGHFRFLFFFKFRNFWNGMRKREESWWTIWHCLHVFIFYFWIPEWWKGPRVQSCVHVCHFRLTEKATLPRANFTSNQLAWLHRRETRGKKSRMNAGFRMLKISIIGIAMRAVCLSRQSCVINYFSVSTDLQIKLKWAPKYYFFHPWWVHNKHSYFLKLIGEMNSNWILIECVWLIIGKFIFFYKSNKWLMIFQLLGMKRPW